MNCTNEVLILIGVSKAFVNIIKYSALIILIVLCTFDLFRIIIINDEKDIKKYRKYIYNRIFCCILLFFIPTIMFVLFDALTNDNGIVNISEIQKCWNII